MGPVSVIGSEAAPLYGAPEQTVITDPSGTGSTVPGSTVPGPTSTVVQPDENLKGQIIPPRDVQC